MALWRASSFVFPQLPSSEPLPPRLMLATLIPLEAALAATQSTPQITEEKLPNPALLRTRTASFLLAKQGSPLTDAQS